MNNLKRILSRFSSFYLVIPVLLLVTGCGTSDSGGGDWLIPESQVIQGGPGRDGIPSIDSPQFAPVSQTDYVGDDRFVVGVKIGDTIKLYPHQIMDRHEIVNDAIGNRQYALTYCPLTGTGICWDRNIDGNVTEFGVSGLLFRNNLIPFDRNTDSEWSQMQLRGVRGDRSGLNIETVDVVEAPWSTWKTMYPDAQVITVSSGSFPASSYQEDEFLYGEDYGQGNSDPLFPRFNHDLRFPTKKRFHGVITSDVADQEANVKLYPVSVFTDSIRVVADTFDGEEFIVVGSAGANIMASFNNTLNGEELTFEAVQNELPVVMEDGKGNRWNIFGEAVSGPDTGEKLAPTESYTGYWFAWIDFFPDAAVFEEE